MSNQPQDKWLDCVAVFKQRLWHASSMAGIRQYGSAAACFSSNLEQASIPGLIKAQDCIMSLYLTAWCLTWGRGLVAATCGRSCTSSWQRGHHHADNTDTASLFLANSWQRRHKPVVYEVPGELVHLVQAELCAAAHRTWCGACWLCAVGLCQSLAFARVPVCARTCVALPVLQAKSHHAGPPAPAGLVSACGGYVWAALLPVNVPALRLRDSCHGLFVSARGLSPSWPSDQLCEQP